MFLKGLPPAQIFNSHQPYNHPLSTTRLTLQRSLATSEMHRIQSVSPSARTRTQQARTTTQHAEPAQLQTLILTHSMFAVRIISRIGPTLLPETRNPYDHRTTAQQPTRTHTHHAHDLTANNTLHPKTRLLFTNIDHMHI